MAKDVSNEDDDDKFDQMDEDSLGFLEQVRKGKARNFVLSMKGNKVRSMVVKKKPIKEKDRKAARGEGYQPVFGVVTGMAAKINFSIARSDGFDEKAADRKTEKLKKFLSHQTGKVFKPTFELVAAPPPIPFDDEDLNDPLIAKFTKMEPVIVKACDMHPDRVQEIQETVNTIRGLLQDDETRQQAGPKIDEFVQFLKELMAGKAPTGSVTPTAAEPSQPPSASPADQAAKLAEALKKLKPLVDRAVDADAQRKSELHATMTQIAGEIKDKQLDKAKQNITDFATLLKALVSQAPTQSSSEQVDRSMEFAEKRNALESRLLEAQRADPDKATKLAGVWDYASDQATANNFANAFKALDRLTEAIDGILAAPRKSDTEKFGIEDQAEDFLQSPGAGATATKPASSAGLFNERLKGLLAKIKAAAGTAAGDQAKLKAGEAGTFAGNQDFANANSLLDQVEAALSGGGGSQQGTSQAISAEFIQHWERAAASWENAMETVDGQLERLRVALVKEDDPDLKRIAEFGLNAVTGDHSVPLQAAIMEVKLAGHRVSAKLIAKAQEMVEDFQDHIETDDQVEACDDNPFDINVTIRDTLGPALSEMDQALRRAFA